MEMKDFVIPKIRRVKNLKIMSKSEEVLVHHTLLSKEQDDLYRNTLWELYKTKKGCDLVVRIHNEEFKCHSLFLHSSKYLSRKIVVENKLDLNVVDLSDIISEKDAEVFRQILKFFYHGRLYRPPKGDELRFYQVAKKLEIHDVEDFYLSAMASFLHPSDAVQLVGYALKQDFTHLFDMLMKVLRNHMGFVLRTEIVQKLPKEVMMGIFQSSNICCSEIQLFQGAVRWCKHQAEMMKTKDEEIVVAEKTKELFKEFEPHIRYPLISIREMLSIVEPSKLVDPEHLLRAFQYHALPSDLRKKRFDLLNDTQFSLRSSVVFNFKFSNSPKGQRITLSSGNMRAVMSGSNCQTVYGDRCIRRSGIYFWEIEVVRTLPTNTYIMTGVADVGRANVNQFFANTERGWGLYHNMGKKYHRSQSLDYVRRRILTGSKIGVVLNFQDIMNGKIFFIVDGVNYGMAFEHITPPVWPAVTLYSPNDEVMISKKPSFFDIVDSLLKD